MLIYVLNISIASNWIVWFSLRRYKCGRSGLSTNKCWNYDLLALCNMSRLQGSKFINFALLHYSWACIVIFLNFCQFSLRSGIYCIVLSINDVTNRTSITQILDPAWCLLTDIDSIIWLDIVLNLKLGFILQTGRLSLLVIVLITTGN